LLEIIEELNEGKPVDLPIEIITMDSLMKRWNMSFSDIFLIVLNQDLAPVYNQFPEPGWKKNDDPDHDVLEVFLKDDVKPNRIVFLKSDVMRLEEKFGGQVSKSIDILIDKDVIERWGISKIELWNLQEEFSLPVVDPLGIEIEDFSTVDLHLVPYPKYHKLEFYFRLSDIEKLENKYEINPKTDLMVKKGTRQRPSQIHKERCRAVAKELWKENLEITIADMAVKDEITEACDGKLYIEKTIRDWIKDLCPDRSPGRRPKKIKSP
jgi:hypothetical protein